MAKPPLVAAKRPVKNTVPPIDVYFADSVGHLFKSENDAPEQNQKKLLSNRPTGSLPALPSPPVRSVVFF